LKLALQSFKNKVEFYQLKLDKLSSLKWCRNSGISKMKLSF